MHMGLTRSRILAVPVLRTTNASSPPAADHRALNVAADMEEHLQEASTANRFPSMTRLSSRHSCRATFAARHHVTTLYNYVHLLRSSSSSCSSKPTPTVRGTAPFISCTPMLSKAVVVVVVVVVVLVVSCFDEQIDFCRVLATSGRLQPSRCGTILGPWLDPRAHSTAPSDGLPPAWHVEALNGVKHGNPLAKVLPLFTEETQKLSRGRRS